MKATGIQFSLVALALVFAGGCGRTGGNPNEHQEQPASPPPAAPVPVHKDPVAEFKKIIENVPLSPRAAPSGNYVYFDDVTYDVQKTDSLISPYMGIIEYKIRKADNATDLGSGLGKDKVKSYFDWQDDKWIYKKSEVKFCTGSTGHLLQGNFELVYKIMPVREADASYDDLIAFVFASYK